MIHGNLAAVPIDQVGATVATVKVGADSLTAILIAAVDAEAVEPVADQRRITAAARLVVQRETENLWGQRTEPRTAVLAVKSKVPTFRSIHGLWRKAPPPFGLV